MRYRKLTSDGDYTFGSGSDFFVNNPEAVAQAVKTRLLLMQGEWFLDVTEGTPYETEILGERKQPTYDAAIQARILGTQGVDSIESYGSELDRRTRSLSVQAVINTIYSQSVTVETVLEVGT